MSLLTALPTLLAKLPPPGEFQASGTQPLPLVRIAVDGAGTLGLPVPAVQAEALSRLAEPAPYGRGAETLLDPSVRRCGQLPATAVHLEDPRWIELVGRVIRAATAGLGVSGTVYAQLYKLLVYGPGDFFTVHRDGEKTPGMFGTLVIALPSEHQGGELRVEHGGREAILPLQGEDLGLVHWAAFYADCRHELLPVRAGWRVVLVYNLVRRKAVLGPPDASAAVHQAAELLRAWPAEGPDKLVLPLAHRYTAPDLAFASLKAADVASARVLRAAAEQAGCELRLAVIAIRESGAAEEEWGRRGPSGRFTIVEVCDRSEEVDGWRRPDDTPEPRGALPFLSEELAPPGALTDAAPDEQEFSEASGNEGGSFERSWRRAAFVLWPRSHEAAMIAQNRPSALVPRLRELAARPETRALARDVALAAVPRWGKTARMDFRPHGEAPYELQLATILLDLGEIGAAGEFLVRAVPGLYEPSARSTVSTILGRVSEAHATAFLGAVARTAWSAPVVAGLLRVASEGALAGAAAGLAPVLLAEREGRRWHYASAEDDAAMLGDLLVVAARARAPGLAAELVRAAQAAPKRWSLDGGIIPALERLAAAGVPLGPVRRAVEPLVTAAEAHLAARVALALTPPPDARRESSVVTCTCPVCKEFRAFLENPKAMVYEYRAAERQRGHLMESAARADVEARTVKDRSPYLLELTKTTASYDRRQAQRREDQRRLAVLRGIWGA